MQLINRKKLSLADKLAVAATALVGLSATAHAQNAEDNDDWAFVGTILTYSEPDRVTAVEGILTAEKNINDTAKLSYKLVLDALTGASANGAIAQTTPQTFTRPSGKGRYVTEANETPLDDTFKDTRVQFNVNWSDALSEDSSYSIGSNLSKEYDYLSISFNGEYAKSFDRKNTTLSIGGSFASDTITPEGGRPLAGSSMIIDNGQFVNNEAYWQAFDGTRISGDGSVDTAELLLGWTQVVNRRMLMQFNYSFANMSGYLTDPFKVVSVVNNNAETQDNIYENRPDSRAQHTVYSLMKYHLDDSVVDLSYRYLTDDWDIRSHTLDFKWHLFAGNNSFWEPHLRFYQQSAAEFYQPYLLVGANPEFVSADYRVGEMTAITLGLKYGFNLSGGDHAEIRAEYYKQTPKASGNEADVNLGNLDIYPEVDAFAIQFTYFF